MKSKSARQFFKYNKINERKAKQVLRAFSRDTSEIGYCYLRIRALYKLGLIKRRKAFTIVEMCRSEDYDSRVLGLELLSISEKEGWIQYQERRKNV